MSETYECDNCGEDVPATVGGEGLHKCSECVPISELEELADEMNRYGSTDVDRFAAKLRWLME